MVKKINTVREIRLQYKSNYKGIKLPIITCSEESYKALIEHYDHDYLGIREEMVVLYLNNANKVLGAYKGFSGGISSTVVDIRLILAVALKGLSTGIILSHNHPSGSLTPSDADKKLTSQLKEAAELFNIKVLDHIILGGQSSYFSFADDGLL